MSLVITQEYIKAELKKIEDQLEKLATDLDVCGKTISGIETEPGLVNIRADIHLNASYERLLKNEEYLKEEKKTLLNTQNKLWSAVIAVISPKQGTVIFRIFTYFNLLSTNLCNRETEFWQRVGVCFLFTAYKRK